VYSILQGPRADATEAVVLIAAWRNMAGAINYSGVALVLTLARYFARWSLWSKDIIFLIPSDSTAGPQAWVDAYHAAHNPSSVSPLTLKSGALQGAIALDYPAGPWGQRFDKLHVVYDGINGQLPNLDLINTAVNIANTQMGMQCTLQRMWAHDDGYAARLETMLRGMVNQGLGHATGPHSSFIPYHVDAVTLQTVGEGWHDEMSLGRTVEGIMRSLNNLLEHLHQSFFFYLLMQANRFVSIGTYLPSAMLVAGSATVMSIALWVQSGRTEGKAPTNPASTSTDEKEPRKEKEDVTLAREGDALAVIPTAQLAVTERHLFLPMTLLSGIHFLGLAPLYIFNHLSPATLPHAFLGFMLATLPLPYLLAYLLPRLLRAPTSQELTLLQCFALMLSGLFLSALATLNFSLSLIIGILSAPFSFTRPLSSTPPSSSTSTSISYRLPLNALQILTLTLLSPPFIITAAATLSGIAGVALKEVLEMAMAGWWVHGLWTSLVVWLVWWPAWFAASFVVGCGIFS
jgi:glycosylphosphatidylinositol transamidase